MQTIAVDLHLTGETPVGGVEACQVFQAGQIGQIVQCNDLEARLRPSLDQCAQDTAADATVTVECNFVGTRMGHAGLTYRKRCMTIAGQARSHASQHSRAGVGAGLPRD